MNSHTLLTDNASSAPGLGRFPSRTTSSSPPAILNVVMGILGVLLALVGYGLAERGGGLVGAGAAVGLLALTNPRSALWLGSAVLMVAFVVFPSTPPDTLVGTAPPTEYYFWAVASVLSALGLGIALLFRPIAGRRQFTRRLRSSESVAMALMFLVCVASGVYGQLLGNGTSLVLRQFYGTLLFFMTYLCTLYFLPSMKDVAWVLNRLKTAAVLTGLAYSVWLIILNRKWLGVIGEESYYRVATPLAHYSGVFMVVAFAQLTTSGRPRRKSRFLVEFLIFAVTLALFGARASTLVAIASILLLVSLRLWKSSGLVWLRDLSLFLLLAIVSVLLLQTASPGSDFVRAVAQRFLAPWEMDASYEGRLAQWSAIVESVKDHPLLGVGLGGSLTFYFPYVRQIMTWNYIDNGWGFVLHKMGLLGLGALLFMLARFVITSKKLLRSGRRLPDPSLLYSLVGAFAYSVLAMFGGPSFFHFLSAGVSGILLGSMVIVAQAEVAPQPVRSSPSQTAAVSRFVQQPAAR